MKQALKFIDEINRKKLALQKTKSKYLRHDYSKSIDQDIKELKEYCKYKGIDLIEVKDENTLYPEIMITQGFSAKTADDFQAVLNRRIAELRGRK